MSKKKRPKTSYNISGKKQPSTIENPTEYYSKYPIWKFSRSDKEHIKWSVSEEKINKDFIDKLIRFEEMTWGDIVQTYGGKSRGNNHHQVNILDMISEAQKRAEDLKLGEYQEFFCLRLSGKSRLWGILEDGIFNIIWIDLEHEICPSTKRHT